MKGILWDTAGRAQEEALSQLCKPSSVNKHFKTDEVQCREPFCYAHSPVPGCTVSLLHMNFQVADFQEMRMCSACQSHEFSFMCQVYKGHVNQICSLPSSTVDSTEVQCFYSKPHVQEASTKALVMQLEITVLFKVLYGKIKVFSSHFVFIFYVLFCVKIISLLQYSAYTADHARLTLLD